MSGLNFRKEEKREHHAIGHCFISTRFLLCQELFPFAPTSLYFLAVLTKVVQEQQKTISVLSEKMAELERALKAKGE
jgi:hypothetical protein